MKTLSDLIIEFYEKLSSWEHSVVEGSGITLPQMHTIEILGVNDGIRMKDLAAKMGVTTGTLTVMIDNLEKKNLVERIPNPDDRRSYVIKLSPEGVDHYRRHSNFHLELTRECVSKFSDEEIQTFRSLLQEFISHI
ncbi:transcriptional regulator [Desulfosarcina widdelii]|uniref:Transcriptional regulator n=1 Tax=Desulfosarcina widdelii TaxID=947919 RepID=A0A5K7ZCZ1_9BACT|nr:MarR family transcriptional regulator [Desulfosarcina widdelii]BBO76324.1 transcriptional regulator [Desulfosarcina widdelii]